MRPDNSWIYNLDWLGDGFDDSLRVVNDIDLPIIFEGSCKPENPPCGCPKSNVVSPDSLDGLIVSSCDCWLFS